MTDRVCFLYTQAFIQYLQTLGELTKHGESIAVAGDLRPGTPGIKKAVMVAIESLGYKPIDCGFIPTPAVTLYGLVHGMPSIMVTGSHIPEDRNGIKFNRKSGEILKSDETQIRVQQLEYDEELFDSQGNLKDSQKSYPIDDTAKNEYKARYLNFLPKDLFKGLRIGVYQHSAVGRDILAEIVKELGAETILLGRSETFVPVDTEAVRQEDIDLARQWAAEYKLDVIFSTDGDSDRPLISDEKGNWLRGDVAGILCARFLNAATVVTPVSCNSALEKTDWFNTVVRTKIGSPYVVEAMQKASSSRNVVVGYEANGGFLLQSAITHSDTRKLVPLPTRDAFIVLFCIVYLSIFRKRTISQLLAELPKRFTFSDRLQNFPQVTSQSVLAYFVTAGLPNVEKIEKIFSSQCGKFKKADLTDGVRLFFENHEVIHFRPSGNAPEFRCYTEADSLERAEELNRIALKWVSDYEKN